MAQVGEITLAHAGLGHAPWVSMRVVVVLAMLSSVAAADGYSGQFELAIHGGADARTGNDSHAVLSSPMGTGGAVDVELGWRYRAFSAAAMYAYSGIHASGDLYDTQGMPPFTYNEWFAFSELGVRGRVHALGAFAGVTIARATISEAGLRPNTGAYFDAHLGYETPELHACRCGFEAIASKGTVPDADHWSFSSYQFVAGVRFHWPVDW